jgi:hypothetical protein
VSSLVSGQSTAEPVGGEGKVNDSAEQSNCGKIEPCGQLRCVVRLRMYRALYILILRPTSRREMRGFKNSVQGSTADVLLKVVDGCRLCRDERLNHVAD